MQNGKKNDPTSFYSHPVEGTNNVDSKSHLKRKVSAGLKKKIARHNIYDQNKIHFYHNLTVL